MLTTTILTSYSMPYTYGVPLSLTGLLPGAMLCLVSSTVGTNIKRLREKADITQTELADRIGVKQPAVWKWENDRSGLPETPTLFKLAKALQCSIDDLLAGVDPDYEPLRHQADVDAETIDVSGYVKNDIPVIAEGEASPMGSLFFDEEGRLKAEVTDRVSRPYDLKDAQAYGVRVRGDSMLPVFRPGMVLIVSPNTPLRDGDEAYVLLRSGERLIKIVHPVNGGYLLESTNPAYDPRLVKVEDVIAVHTVVWSKRASRGVRIVQDETP
jgi:phage repressor protein C with HTH and peptisase S24 domain